MYPALSRFMLSECCNAPVGHQYNFPGDNWPVTCLACHHRIACPTTIDIDQLKKGKRPRGVLSTPEFTEFVEHIKQALTAMEYKHLREGTWEGPQSSGDD